MGDNIEQGKPTFVEVPIRTSCSRPLIVELAGAMGLGIPTNPDDVLRVAIKHIKPLNTLEDRA